MRGSGRLSLRQHGRRHCRGTGRRERQRTTAVYRSLRAREIHRAGDERTVRAGLSSRTRRRSQYPTRIVRRRAVHPRRGHAGRGRVRRAVLRLQLDGVSGQRRLRRLLDGHGRVRPFDASDGDERPLQPCARAAGTVRADSRSEALPAVIPGQRDDDRLRLERYLRHRGLRARAEARRQAEPRRLVAGRTARRRLHGAASGKSPAPGAARAGVRAHGS